MKRLLILFYILMWNVQFLVGQSRPVEQLLQDQVTAFNRHDVDELVENISADFKWFYVTSDTLLREISGKPSFRENMKGYFNSFPTVHAEIVGYVVEKNRISFNERVTWTKDGVEKSQSAMGVYEVKDNKIHRCWYFVD